MFYNMFMIMFFYEFFLILVFDVFFMIVYVFNVCF